MASEVITVVTEYIRNTYSSDGIDVTANSDGHIVCALPEEIQDLGGITADLEQRYGCTLDMRQSKQGNGFELVAHVPPTLEKVSFYPSGYAGADQGWIAAMVFKALTAAAGAYSIWKAVASFTEEAGAP